MDGKHDVVDEDEPDGDSAPLRLRRPCRIIRVKRTTTSFDVIGETLLCDVKGPVRWRVQRFPYDASCEDEAERAANEAGGRFARRIPTWFNGCAYFVDSSGRVTEIVEADNVRP